MGLFLVLQITIFGALFIALAHGLTSQQHSELNRIRTKVQRGQDRTRVLRNGFHQKKDEYSKTAAATMQQIRHLIGEANRQVQNKESEKSRQCANLQPNSSQCNALVHHIIVTQKQIMSSCETNVHNKIKNFYANYKRDMRNVLKSVRDNRKYTNDQMKYIKSQMAKPQYVNLDALLLQEMKKLEENHAIVNHIHWLTNMEISRIDELFYGDLCFKIFGANGVIPAQGIPHVNDALAQALSLVLANEGMEVEVDKVVVVRQEFNPSRRRLTSTERGLRKKNKLRIGSIASWRCNCREDWPISDVFARRRRMLGSGEEESTDLQEELEQFGADIQRELWTPDSVRFLNTLIAPTLLQYFPNFDRITPIPCGDFI